MINETIRIICGRLRILREFRIHSGGLLQFYRHLLQTKVSALLDVGE